MSTLAGPFGALRSAESPAADNPASFSRPAPRALIPPMPAPPVPPAGSRAPERWALSAGDAATATLVIPADAARDRQFEIACAITVAVPVGGPKAWHQMTVQANGVQQWRRRLDSQNPGEWDGMDYRFRQVVPVGKALRVTVSVAGGGVRRRSLTIEADEA